MSQGKHQNQRYRLLTNDAVDVTKEVVEGVYVRLGLIKLVGHVAQSRQGGLQALLQVFRVRDDQSF